MINVVSDMGVVLHEFEIEFLPENIEMMNDALLVYSNASFVSYSHMNGLDMKVIGAKYHCIHEDRVWIFSVESTNLYRIHGESLQLLRTLPFQLPEKVHASTYTDNGDLLMLCFEGLLYITPKSYYFVKGHILDLSQPLILTDSSEEFNYYGYVVGQNLSINVGSEILTFADKSLCLMEQNKPYIIDVFSDTLPLVQNQLLNRLLTQPESLNTEKMSLVTLLKTF